MERAESKNSDSEVPHTLASVTIDAPAPHVAFQSRRVGNKIVTVRETRSVGEPMVKGPKIMSSVVHTEDMDPVVTSRDITDSVMGGRMSSAASYADNCSRQSSYAPRSHSYAGFPVSAKSRTAMDALPQYRKESTASNASSAVPMQQARFHSHTGIYTTPKPQCVPPLSPSRYASDMPAAAASRQASAQLRERSLTEALSTCLVNADKEVRFQDASDRLSSFGSDSVGRSISMQSDMSDNLSLRQMSAASQISANSTQQPEISARSEGGRRVVAQIPLDVAMKILQRQQQRDREQQAGQQQPGHQGGHQAGRQQAGEHSGKQLLQLPPVDVRKSSSASASSSVVGSGGEIRPARGVSAASSAGGASLVSAALPTNSQKNSKQTEPKRTTAQVQGGQKKQLLANPAVVAAIKSSAERLMSQRSSDGDDTNRSALPTAKSACPPSPGPQQRVESTDTVAPASRNTSNGSRHKALMEKIGVKVPDEY